MTWRQDFTTPGFVRPFQLEPPTHFCGVCGTRVVGSNGEEHPCPFGPHEEAIA